MKIAFSKIIFKLGFYFSSILLVTFPKYLLLIPKKWNSSDKEEESPNLPVSSTLSSLIKLGIAEFNK
jgi:hypothetical protein